MDDPAWSTSRSRPFGKDLVQRLLAFRRRRALKPATDDVRAARIAIELVDEPDRRPVALLRLLKRSRTRDAPDKRRWPRRNSTPPSRRTEKSASPATAGASSSVVPLPGGALREHAVRGSGRRGAGLLIGCRRKSHDLSKLLLRLSIPATSENEPCATRLVPAAQLDRPNEPRMFLHVPAAPPNAAQTSNRTKRIVGPTPSEQVLPPRADRVERLGVDANSIRRQEPGMSALCRRTRESPIGTRRWLRLRTVSGS